MLGPELLDKMEHMARILRQNPSPFGGIQLVLCGDWFQLQVFFTSYMKYIAAGQQERQNRRISGNGFLFRDQDMEKSFQGIQYYRVTTKLSSER
jgi:hypothetical protein